MMKKFTAFFISILLILGLFSCSDINSGEISYKETSAILASGNNFFLSIFSSERIFVHSASKTLLPSSFDENSLNYYLFYVDLQKSSLSNDYTYYGKLNLQYDSSTSATATIDLLPSVYRFALYACYGDFASPSVSTLNSSACLLGYATADLNSVRQIALKLSAETLSSGGNVNISINSDWGFPSNWDLTPSGTSKVCVGIYDLATGEPAFSNQNPYYLTYGAAADISDTVHLSNYTFGSTKINPGTYSFVIKFINLETGKTFEYNDTILILANQTTYATVDVPNVIGTEPLAPSDFAVAYTDPDDDKDFYLADFSWTDNANNETGFEIQIADISCGYSNISGNSASLLIPDLSSDYNWEVSVSNAAYPSDNVTTYDAESYKNYISYYYQYFGSSSSYNPENYSLIRNNTAAKFYFQLGKRYVARIRAVNDIGNSAWCYAVFDGGSCASINRFRISYATKTGEVVTYRSQNESGVTIDTPSDTEWISWYVGSVSYDASGNADSTNRYPVTGGVCDSYTGHENLSLIGYYTDNDTPGPYAWSDYDVVLWGRTDSAAAIYLDDLSATDNKCKNGQKITVKKSEVASLEWIITSQAKDYDTVSLQICDTRDTTVNKVDSLWDVSTKMWTTPISDWQTGYYLANLVAEKDGVKYSFMVVLELKN